mmetsp:Transcript_31274/g.99731  ORF Transcript_31274/g.99731 Transcript_31274/m.99731 type:complete len:217 (-) Transcript_31274:677-1327(-)
MLVQSSAMALVQSLALVSGLWLAPRWGWGCRRSTKLHCKSCSSPPSEHTSRPPRPTSLRSNCRTCPRSPPTTCSKNALPRCLGPESELKSAPPWSAPGSVLRWSAPGLEPGSEPGSVLASVTASAQASGRPLAQVWAQRSGLGSRAQGSERPWAQAWAQASDRASRASAASLPRTPCLRKIGIFPQRSRTTRLLRQSIRGGTSRRCPNHLRRKSSK